MIKLVLQLKLTHVCNSDLNHSDVADVFCDTAPLAIVNRGFIRKGFSNILVFLLGCCCDNTFYWFLLISGELEIKW